MKSLLPAILITCLLACSPYKKVVLSDSDRLTKNWKGVSETNVLKAYGAYKHKYPASDGYLLSFDYSYASRPAPAASGNIQVKASNQRSSPMLPSSQDSYSGQRTGVDSVIKRIDFFFDKSQHVQYVQTIGFPDSVYYIKRK